MFSLFDLLRDSLAVYSQVRDEIKRLFREAQAKDPAYANFAIGQLHFYSERCQSVNVLVQEGKLWDCDILMRSALECATRFLFVSVAESDERNQRIAEYTVLLAEIEDLQRAEKTRTAAKNALDPDTVMIMDGAVLSDDRIAALRAKWPKPKRTALQQKWAFSEMARALTSVHKQEIDLRPYGSLLHSYAMSSHLIHADQTAVNLIWDRRGRPFEELRAMEDAHAARLITEPVAILFLCWRALAFAIEAPSQSESAVRAFLDLERKADKYHQAFADTQRSRYK